MADLLCTEFDIVDKIPQLWDNNRSIYNPRSLRDIQNIVIESDGMLRTALRQIYGADLTSGITPWAKFPEALTAPRAVNGGNGVLAPEMIISSSAITELWTLTFTSETEYSFSGSISSSQGTGATDTDSASTNVYLTVPSAKWSGTPDSGDVFYVRVYEVEAAVVNMSSLFAAALLLDSMYTEEVPNRTEMANGYRDTAETLLEKYTDEDFAYALEVGRSVRDLDPIPIAGQMVIDEEGQDIGVYAEDEYDIALGERAHDF